jgi:hypothetical protein
MLSRFKPSSPPLWKPVFCAQLMLPVLDQGCRKRLFNCDDGTLGDTEVLLSD